MAECAHGHSIRKQRFLLSENPMELCRTVLEPILIANIDVDRTIVPQIVDVLIDERQRRWIPRFFCDLWTLWILPESRNRARITLSPLRVHHVFRWQLWNLT